MVKLIENGAYELIETMNHVQVLTLNNRSYSLVLAEHIGEIMVATHNPFIVDHVLASGRYRIYDVRDEPGLVDEPHLELEVGDYHWQGYLLPTGLPTNQKKRSRIIATKELVPPPRGMLHRAYSHDEEG